MSELEKACAQLVAMGLSTGHADTAIELVGECITNLAELQDRVNELKDQLRAQEKKQ